MQCKVQRIGANSCRHLNKAPENLDSMNLFDGPYLDSLLLEGLVEKSIDLDMLLRNEMHSCINLPKLLLGILHCGRRSAATDLYKL